VNENSAMNILLLKG